MLCGSVCGGTLLPHSFIALMRWLKNSWIAGREEEERKFNRSFINFNSKFTWRCAIGWLSQQRALRSWQFMWVAKIMKWIGTFRSFHVSISLWRKISEKWWKLPTWGVSNGCAIYDGNSLSPEEFRNFKLIIIYSWLNENFKFTCNCGFDHSFTWWIE